VVVTRVTIDRGPQIQTMGGMQSDGRANSGAPPPELIDAVARALERQRTERNAEKYARVLAGTRAVLDAWRRGRMTAAQAVLLVRVTSSD
jgi:hypothetical protein